MATLTTNLLDPQPWSGPLIGNHALVRAMLEANTRVITTFPGSPTPEIAAAIWNIPEDNRPFYFEFSINEKVATEVAAAASMNGHLSCTFYKSVGLNVAADSLIQLGLLELIGGMVIILGDDPGANSSQNEQDNRHFSRMSYIPMFEPATPQEAYEMYLEAAELSQKHQMPVFLRSTTHVCHAKQVVRFGPLDTTPYDWTPRFDVANGPYIPLTVDVFPLKRNAFAKLKRVEEDGNRSSKNTVLAPNGVGPLGGKRLGIISTALPALCLLENLEEAEVPIDLLKLGITYPLARGKISEFLKNHDEVLLVEELDRIFELEIKTLAYDSGTPCRILARGDDEDMMGEFDPIKTWSLLSKAWPDHFPDRKAQRSVAEVSPRLPQMCPGCGHRIAFHSVKNALEKEAITVGDIGCHTMGYMIPYQMGQLLLSMGHSLGSGAGFAIGNETRKVVTFLGDSTLFHAGFPGIVNAIVNNHNITLVLLDNGTTAMTGHQPRAGSGEIGDKISFEELFKTLGVKFYRETDAYNGAKVVEYVKEAQQFKGFAVVNAKHPCMLLFSRKRRKTMPDAVFPRVGVDQATCDRSMVCLREFGCPSFVHNEDGSITVHEDLCIGDGSCVQTCPVNALAIQKPGGAK